MGTMAKQWETTIRVMPHRPWLTSEIHLPRSASQGISIHENRRPQAEALGRGLFVCKRGA